MKKKTKISKKLSDVNEAQTKDFATRPNLYAFLEDRGVESTIADDAQQFVVDWILKEHRNETRRARRLIQILEDNIEITSSRIAYKLDSIFEELK